MRKHKVNNIIKSMKTACNSLSEELELFQNKKSKKHIYFIDECEQIQQSINYIRHFIDAIEPKVKIMKLYDLPLCVRCSKLFSKDVERKVTSTKKYSMCVPCYKEKRKEDAKKYYQGYKSNKITKLMNR